MADVLSLLRSGFQAAGRVVGIGQGKQLQTSQMLNSQQGTELVNPPGSLPTQLMARASGWADPANLSTVADDIIKIQGALRQAERGDTRILFTLYRDMILGSTHIQAELNKRKMVVAGQVYNIQPVDKENPDDAKACDYIKDMIEDAENWDMAMGYSMDAAIWPISVLEKIYDPFPDNMGRKRPVRYALKKTCASGPLDSLLQNSLSGSGWRWFPAISRSKRDSCRAIQRWKESRRYDLEPG